MREIKFRAWNTDYHPSPIMEYFEWFDIHRIERMCDKEIMQYTCLKDKNDKEIYEGDVVKRTVDMANYSEGYGTEENIYEVKWVGIELCPFSETSCHMEEFEVIGNIYENPELLNA